VLAVLRKKATLPVRTENLEKDHAFRSIFHPSGSARKSGFFPGFGSDFQGDVCCIASQGGRGSGQADGLPKGYKLMNQKSSSVHVVFSKNPMYIPPAGEECPPTGFEVEDTHGLPMNEYVRQEAKKFGLERILMAQAKAEAIEANPEKAIRLAKQHVKKFVNRKNGAQIFFKEWERILEEQSPQEICALLRSTNPSTEQLRISAPIFGVAENTYPKIYNSIYETSTHSYA
jgi:hypothetical protein